MHLCKYSSAHCMVVDQSDDVSYLRQLKDKSYAPSKFVKPRQTYILAYLVMSHLVIRDDVICTDD